MRSPEDRRAALVAVAQGARAHGAAVLGFASSGLPGPKGNRETFVWLAEAGRAARRSGSRRRSPARWSRDRRAPAPPPCSPTPARRRPPRRCAPSSRPPSARACCCASTPRRRASTGSRRATASSSTRRSATTSSCACRSAATARSCARCAATRARACRSSPSTTARSASWPPIDPDEDGDLPGAFERALAGDFEVLTLPGARAGDARGPAGGDQRRRDPPPRGRARGRARLRDRRRGGGVGALRRPRAVDARGLDGLQPRQRRPGAGLGRGGLRRVVHRAALADRAGAGGRPERPAVGPQPLAGRRSTSRSTGARPGQLGPGDAITASFLREAADLAQVPGLVVLPASAPEVREVGP